MSLLHGFDVSAYNPTKVPACDFALVKASEGDRYTSSTFAPQWASAGQVAGWRAGYHFARPEESSAKSQADRLINLVRPRPGEGLCLDLEASKLSASATNAWARTFGDRLWEKAPGVTTVLYMGAGYATSATGRGLVGYFDFWMYPQYPNTYQVHSPELEEIRRRTNRSHYNTERTLLAPASSAWPTSMTPWLPSGLTCGWERPDLWQFTDNHAGLDASVTALTIAQLAAGGHPLEDDMYAQAGKAPTRVGETISSPCPKGTLDQWGVWFDSPNKLTYRIAARSASGHGEIKEDLVVGGPASKTDSWPAKPAWKTSVKDVNAFSIRLVKIEGPDVEANPAWTPDMPDVNGNIVLPGWDASHS